MRPNPKRKPCLMQACSILKHVPWNKMNKMYLKREFIKARLLCVFHVKLDYGYDVKDVGCNVCVCACVCMHYNYLALTQYIMFFFLGVYQASLSWETHIAHIHHPWTCLCCWFWPNIKSKQLGARLTDWRLVSISSKFFFSSNIAKLLAFNIMNGQGRFGVGHDRHFTENVCKRKIQ